MLRRFPVKRLALLPVAVFAVAVGCPAGAVAAAPDVSAPAAIAVEPATGDVVFSRNASQERPIASTTKLMTALVTIENTKLDDVVTTVPYNASPVESTGGFRGGERVKVRTLLRAMLVASANDAAATLAARVGGTRAKFVAMMNARAREAGLQHTHFENPIGLDAPGNYSSAADIVKIALLLRRDPFIRQTTAKPAVTITSGGRTRTLRNRNLLIGHDPYATGVKTGHTQGAGWVLVGSGSKNGVTLVTAVLGASSEAARLADTRALMRYGFSRYRVVTAARAGSTQATVKLKGRSESVPLVVREDVRATVRKGSVPVLRPVIPAEVDGPLPAGAEVGKLETVYERRVISSVPLVTTAAITAAPTGSSAARTVGIIVLVVIALALLGTIRLLVLRRRRVASAGSGARTA